MPWHDSTTGARPQWMTDTGPPWQWHRPTRLPLDDGGSRCRLSQLAAVDVAAPDKGLWLGLPTRHLPTDGMALVAQWQRRCSSRRRVEAGCGEERRAGVEDIDARRGSGVHRGVAARGRADRRRLVAWLRQRREWRR